jgi:hypothetical protein
MHQSSFPVTPGSIAGVTKILPPKETDAFDLDGLLLGLAAQQVINSLAQGETARLLVNIRFDVFGTRAATERYAALCMKMDPRVSKHLTLLLTSLPEGLPRSRQAECIGRLLPYCGAVGFQVDELVNLATLDLSQSVNPLVALPAAALASIPPERINEAIRALHTRRARVLVRRIRARCAQTPRHCVQCATVQFQVEGPSNPYWSYGWAVTPWPKRTASRSLGHEETRPTCPGRKRSGWFRLKGGDRRHRAAGDWHGADRFVPPQFAFAACTARKVIPMR